MSGNEIKKKKPLFLSTDWLNLVNKNQFKIIEFKKNNQLFSDWPIIEIQNKLGMKGLVMPNLSLYSGPSYYFETEKSANLLDQKKEALDYFIEKFSKYDFIELNIYNDEYLFPFLWNDFKIESSFTYRLRNIKNFDNLWSNIFSQKIKTQYRKATKLVHLDDLCSLDDVYDLLNLTFNRQKKKNPYNKEIIFDVIKHYSYLKKGKVFMAKDENQIPHAFAFVVWDEYRAYNLLSGGNPSFRNSDATTMVLVEAIKYTSKFVDEFDFEGSSVPTIEKFYRSFGGDVIKITKISKKSLRKKILDFLINFIKLRNYL